MSRLEQVTRCAGSSRLILIALATAGLLLPATRAQAAVDGLSGSSFTLTATAGNIQLPDGGSIYSWGYGVGGQMQLPGPTLIVNVGTPVTVTLNNSLPFAAGNTSIVFPGQQVTTAGGVPGLITREAAPGGSVTYTFTPSSPGTFTYYSGSRPDLQVEMGLFGALIVRPSTLSGCPGPIAGETPFAGAAYDHAGTCFDREYLFVLSEIDIDVHQAAQLQANAPQAMDVPTNPYVPEYWLLNGRAAPDTMAQPEVPWLPSQPYDALARMHPGERVLVRVVGVGRQSHPFHTHGNHARVLARDGRLLLSATDPTKLAGPNLFTIPAVPGGTVDAIFEWTGKELGWDIYGHVAGDGSSCNDAVPSPDGYDDVTKEWCADHTKQIPVSLPEKQVLFFGGMYSGSPFLGVMGQLPPGEGGLNPSAGFTYMWHSHTERELINNDIFPGGLMTMLVIEAPGVEIID